MTNKSEHSLLHYYAIKQQGKLDSKALTTEPSLIVMENDSFSEDFFQPEE
jgi:hypothetical protein